MKPLGAVRKVDELGRIVIPKDVRDRLGIESGTTVEFFATEHGVFVRSYDPTNPMIHDTTIDSVQM